jgi:hypothetical protein
MTDKYFKIIVIALLLTTNIILVVNSFSLSEIWDFTSVTKGNVMQIYDDTFEIKNKLK